MKAKAKRRKLRSTVPGHPDLRWEDAMFFMTSDGVLHTWHKDYDPPAAVARELRARAHGDA